MNISATRLELAMPQGSTRSVAEIDQVAREFESLFAKMMIGSMRQASLGNSLFPNENSLYRDMYDQQLARSLTEGKGLGLADAIRSQLGGHKATVPMASQPPAWLPINTLPAASPGVSNRDRFPELTTAQDTSFTSASASPLESPTKITSTGSVNTGSAEEFVASIWGSAQRAAFELGVHPKMLVAQAALETGWGRHGLQTGNERSANNLFGIKATGSWKGNQVSRVTTEVIDGVAIRQVADFRAYASIEESFNDYVRLIKDNRRYADVVNAGDDAQGFAKALAKAGYATDPHYAEKLIAIAEGPTMRRALDQISPPALATR